MEFLFKYNIVIVHIGQIVMMFEILFDHLVRAPNPVTNGRKMPAPILLAKGREFLLKTARSPFPEPLHKVAQFLRETVFDMYLHMILAYLTLKNPYILLVINLLDQVSAPDLNIAFENMKKIFRDPHHMRIQPIYHMDGPPLMVRYVSNMEKCVAAESLALK